MNDQRHWLNPLIGLLARLTRRNYYWYWRGTSHDDPKKTRHLWFG